MNAKRGEERKKSDDYQLAELLSEAAILDPRRRE